MPTDDARGPTTSIGRWRAGHTAVLVSALSLTVAAWAAWSTATQATVAEQESYRLTRAEELRSAPLVTLRQTDTAIELANRSPYPIFDLALTLQWIADDGRRAVFVDGYTGVSAIEPCQRVEIPLDGLATVNADRTIAGTVAGEDVTYREARDGVPHRGDEAELDEILDAVSNHPIERSHVAFRVTSDNWWGRFASGELYEVGELDLPAASEGRSTRLVDRLDPQALRRVATAVHRHAEDAVLGDTVLEGVERQVQITYPTIEQIAPPIGGFDRAVSGPQPRAAWSSIEDGSCHGQ